MVGFGERVRLAVIVEEPTGRCRLARGRQLLDFSSLIFGWRKLSLAKNFRPTRAKLAVLASAHLIDSQCFAVFL